VLAAWSAEASRRIHLRQVLSTSLHRWSQLTLARAFEQWKDWALRAASLHRRAQTLMSLLAGRTMQWALYMLRYCHCSAAEVVCPPLQHC